MRDNEETDLLEDIKAPKFLRYLYFIAYSYYRSFRSERSDAHFMVVVMFWMFHCFAFVGLSLHFSIITTEFYLLLLAAFIYFALYIFFIRNSKWRKIVDEFSHLKRKDIKKGFIYLFIYLGICVSIMFYFIWSL